MFCAGTPTSFGLKLMYQSCIEVVPESFRLKTPVVPIDRDGTAIPKSIRNDIGNPVFGLLGSQVEIRWIKQCCVHNVQREFK